MRSRIRRFSILGILTVLGLAACLPKATPAVDTMETAVAKVAFELLTQTAAAASPTPPPPTITPTPLATETPTLEPTGDAGGRRPQTADLTGCWFGPGASFVLESNISKGKAVDLLGIGNVPGWYIIRNPYFHRPCWVPAANLKIFPGTDLSKFPVMTPGIPGPGQ